MGAIGAALGRVFDYDPDAEAAVPFSQVAAHINLRRLALAASLGLLQLTFEIYLGLVGPWETDTTICLASVPVEAALLLVAARRPSWLSRPLHQNALAIFSVLFGLGMAIAATASLAMHGRLVSGYSLMVLALAILFVFPLRTLLIILGSATLLYIIAIQGAPVSEYEKLVAATNASLATVVGIAGGWLIHSARERDYLQRQLIHAQARQLESRKQQLDELMAITAHDLQSPLLGLYNLFELTIEKSASNPTLPVRVLRDSQPSIRSMLELVRRLLLAHNAEQDSSTPSLLEDMRLHVAAAVERASPSAESACVSLALVLEATPAWAIFDPIAIGQICDNLIANAIKFSPANGQVTARCVCSDGAVSVTITDNGPGVAEEFRPFLFQRRLGRGTAPRYGQPGSGLGLFIASTLAARNRASISHTSLHPHGALFELKLPHEEIST
ncbi:sensor histidine kinase [Sphingomonas crusticola]|uniref:sensor histidine kinase n=1 Tax=Sphingomonas crusticola TaxID=1697973 RepID=UPI000E269A11|nr:HAMP domain-containing sensor histidine kinase [Sphingomonas crusticola]